MFRFSIRELMLVTLVVAVGVAWTGERGRVTNILAEIKLVKEETKKQIEYAKDSHLKAMIKSKIKSEAMETKLKIDGFEVVQDGLRVEIFSKTEPGNRFVTGPSPSPDWQPRYQSALVRKASETVPLLPTSPPPAPNPPKP